jgi:hypothetical protein
MDELRRVTEFGRLRCNPARLFCSTGLYAISRAQHLPDSRYREELSDVQRVRKVSDVSGGRLRRGCPPVDPKTLAAIDHAFEDAWSVLATRNRLARFANEDELQEELSQRLAVLASDGVTDPEEPRRQALASFPVS